MLVAGIVLSLGVPNFVAFKRSNEMTSAVNGVVSALHLSRTEAVKRQLPVTVCLSSQPLVAAPVCDGSGNGGFVAFVDTNDSNLDGSPDGDAVIDPGEPILVQRADPGGTINVTFDSAYVTYGSNGFVTRPPGLGPPFTTALFCDERGNQDAGNGESVARVVMLSGPGRPQLSREIASVVSAVGSTGGVCP
jgi:Tfp pilus assembly protein FimT